LKDDELLLFVYFPDLAELGLERGVDLDDSAKLEPVADKFVVLSLSNGKVKSLIRAIRKFRGDDALENVFKLDARGVLGALGVVTGVQLLTDLLATICS